MSQVVSIRVPENYAEACAAFQRETSADNCKDNIFTSPDFTVFYDESLHEIRCEGNYPESVFFALVKIRDQFGGKLFYEGEEWNEEDGDEVAEAGLLEKALIVLAIIFFPITLVYLLLRIILWIPFKIWRATR
jgi:hypothetical protein